MVGPRGTRKGLGPDPRFKKPKLFVSARRNSFVRAFVLAFNAKNLTETLNMVMDPPLIEVQVVEKF